MIQNVLNKSHLLRRSSTPLFVELCEDRCLRVHIRIVNPEILDWMRHLVKKRVQESRAIAALSPLEITLEPFRINLNFNNPPADSP